MNACHMQLFSMLCKEELTANEYKLIQ